MTNKDPFDEAISELRDILGRCARRVAVAVLNEVVNGGDQEQQAGTENESDTTEAAEVEEYEAA